LYYDSARKRVYVSGGEGYISVFQRDDAAHYKLLAKVQTAIGARTAGYFGKGRKGLDRFYLAVPARAGHGAEGYARGVRRAVLLLAVGCVAMTGRALAAAPAGLTTGLVPCFLRDRPVAEALELLDALVRADVELLGIGLDSAEVGHPPADFAEVYARARAEGLRLVADAGEEGPAAYVTDALDVLGVERIDHGIRSLEDPDLVRRLARDAVPLTVCPLSNVRLRAVDTLAEHPLVRMLDAGLAVSVHSDDPAYFGGYVDDNHRAVADTLGLSRDQVRTLAENAVEAAFVGDARRAELRAEVAAWADGA